MQTDVSRRPLEDLGQAIAGTSLDCRGNGVPSFMPRPVGRFELVRTKEPDTGHSFQQYDGQLNLHVCRHTRLAQRTAA